MAFTKAQLEALKNSLLASNQPILASQHRQQIQSIIDEMYDAQSRANILVGVQSDSVQGGSDTFLVFRSGQAYQLPVSLLNANDLASLGDVFINNLEDGDSLVYDAVANRWENRSILLGFALSNLTDVELTSLSGGDILRYDSGDDLWKNVSLASLLAPYALLTDLDDYQLLSAKGQPNGYASLDTGGKVPLSQINDAILGQVSYQGTWNASTNTPTLANPPSSATKGNYYVVSVGGTFAGISFQVGDWIISNGTAWEKVNNTDAVRTVFGRLGDVVANANDYASFYVTLNTNQTITGQKTFNSNLILGGPSALRIVQSSTFGSPPNGTSAIDAINTDFVFAVGLPDIGGASQRKQFSIQTSLLTNNTNRFYTLPDASGTIALTNSGTLNFIPKFTPNGTSLGNSQIFDNGTNVGIGNTNPDTKLHIQGISSNNITNITSISGIRIDGNISDTSSTGITFQSGGGGGAGYLLGRDGSFGTFLSFYTNLTTNAVVGAMTERMKINPNGSLTINNLAGTGTLVWVNSSGTLGRVTVGSGLAFNDTNGTLSATGGASGTVTATPSGTSGFVPRFNSATNLINSQIFDNGTNVGIGTTSPSDKLHTFGNIRIGDGTNSPNAGVFVQNNGVGWLDVLVAERASIQRWSLGVGGSGDDFVVFVRTAERMRIASNGRVLINSTSDNGLGQLQVNGNITCSDPTNNAHAVTLAYLNNNSVTVANQSIRNISNGRMQTTTNAFESIFIPNQGSNILLPQRLKEFDISKMATFDSISIKVYFINTTSNSNKLGILKFSLNEFVNEDFLEVTSSLSNPYSGWFEISILNIGGGNYEVFGFLNAVEGLPFSNSAKFRRVLVANTTCRIRLEFLSGIVASPNYGGLTDIQYSIDYKKSDNSLLIN